MKKPTHSKKTVELSATASQLKNEAYRYLENGVTILKEKGKMDIKSQQFDDKKYVKMASHTIYTGVLLALDAVLKLPKKKNNDINEYHKLLSRENRTMNRNLVDVYHIFHLEGGYDGYAKKSIVNEGLKSAREIVDWCVTRVN